MFNHKSANVKGKLTSIHQVMDIEKLHDLNLIKEKVEEFGIQGKSLKS